MHCMLYHVYVVKFQLEVLHVMEKYNYNGVAYHRQAEYVEAVIRDHGNGVRFTDLMTITGIGKGALSSPLNTLIAQGRITRNGVLYAPVIADGVTNDSDDMITGIRDLLLSNSAVDVVNGLRTALESMIDDSANTSNDEARIMSNDDIRNALAMFNQ